MRLDTYLVVCRLSIFQIYLSSQGKILAESILYLGIDAIAADAGVGAVFLG